MTKNKVIIITGAARRIGRVIAKTLHQANYNIIIHYRHSEKEAHSLVTKLNHIRNNSANFVSADFIDFKSYAKLINEAKKFWGRIDGIIHNASSFYATPLGQTKELDWDVLFASSTKAAYFLTQAALEELKKNQGCVINIIDVFGFKPLKNYPIYSMAKASMVMLTKSLSLELAPDIRVNGIAPGSILYPENENKLSQAQCEEIIRRIPLKRLGSPSNIAKGVLFMLQNDYITGEILVIDGGKLLMR